MCSRIVLICCALAFLAPARLLAAATPSPALLILDKEDSSLAIVDPATQKVVGRVPTGEAPHEIVASDDGKLAFVSNYGSKTPGHTLSVIDLAAQTEIHRVDLGPMGRPHGLAYHDGKGYFTAELAKLVGRYDPVTNKVDWLLGTGQNTTHMILFSRDGSQAFTSNIGSNTVTAIAMSKGWDETVIPVGKGPEGIDVSPDGSEVWSASSRDGGVSIIDTATKTVKQTLNIGTRRSNRVKFTPDGKQVLISDMGGNELLVIDAAKREVTRRLRIGRQPEGILVVPEAGSGAARAYIAVSGDNTVAILDLNTMEISGHIVTGREPDGMAWAVRK